MTFSIPGPRQAPAKSFSIPITYGKSTPNSVTSGPKCLSQDKYVPFKPCGQIWRWHRRRGLFSLSTETALIPKLASGICPYLLLCRKVHLRGVGDFLACSRETRRRVALSSRLSTFRAKTRSDVGSGRPSRARAIEMAILKSLVTVTGLDVRQAHILERTISWTHCRRYD